MKPTYRIAGHARESERQNPQNPRQHRAAPALAAPLPRQPLFCNACGHSQCVWLTCDKCGGPLERLAAPGQSVGVIARTLAKVEAIEAAAREQGEQR